MDFGKTLIYSVFIAIFLLFVSIVYPLVPCKIVPNVPNPTSSFDFCSLNPDSTTSFDSKALFFGYTQDLTMAYLIVFISVLLASFLVLYLTLRG